MREKPGGNTYTSATRTDARNPRKCEQASISDRLWQMRRMEMTSLGKMKLRELDTSARRPRTGMTKGEPAVQVGTIAVGYSGETAVIQRL
jgi:hypothetical protein